jgi:hypothetical protein
MVKGRKSPSITDRQTADTQRDANLTYPVSAMQEAWLVNEEYLQTHNLPASTGNVAIGLRFEGTLNYPALVKSVNHIVRKHHLLRACIIPSNVLGMEDRKSKVAHFMATGRITRNLYRYSVRSSLPEKLPVVDLSSMNISSRDATLASQISSELAERFSYSSPPLFRSRLFKLRSNLHLLLLTVPRLVCDGISKTILESDIVSQYKLQTETPPVKYGGIIPETEKSHQFSEFTLHEEAFFRSPAFDVALAHWARSWQRYSSARFQTKELVSRNEPQPRLGLFGSLRVILTREQVGKVRSLARDQRMTLFMLFFALFCLALHRQFRKSKVAVWVDFANRIKPEQTSIVGAFSTTHLLGLDTPPSLPMKEVFAQARQVVIGGLANQSFPAAYVRNYLGSSLEPMVDEAYVSFAYSGTFVDSANRGISNGSDVSIKRFEPSSFLECESIWKAIEALVEDRGKDDIQIIINYDRSIIKEPKVLSLLNSIIDDITKFNLRTR